MVVHKAAFSRWSLVRIGLPRQLVSHGPTEVADPSLRERRSVAPHSHLVEEGQSSDDNAEETEEEVDLVQAAADWSKGEEHGGQEDEAQGQGQEYEALAHVNVNYDPKGEHPGTASIHLSSSEDQCPVFFPSKAQHSRDPFSGFPVRYTRHTICCL